MKWELEALKMLSKNPTVPGVALADAISEIEELQAKLERVTENVYALRSELVEVKRMWKEDLDELRLLRGRD